MCSSCCAGALSLAVERWLSGPGKNSKKGQDHSAEVGFSARAHASLVLFWDYLHDFSSGCFVTLAHLPGEWWVAFKWFSFCGLITVIFCPNLFSCAYRVWGFSEDSVCYSRALQEAMQKLFFTYLQEMQPEVASLEKVWYLSYIIYILHLLYLFH